MGTSWDQQHQESSSNAGLLTTSNASTLASVREADGVRVLSKVVQPKTCPVGYTTSLASWATLKHGFDECTAGIHTLDPCDVPFIYTTRRSGSLYHWFTVQTSNTEVCTVACGPDAGPPPVGGVCKGLPRRAGRMLLGVHGGWQYRFHASPTLPGELLYLHSQSHQLQVEQPRFPV